MSHNLVKQIRKGLLMSKTELARKAGVSALTVSRIEKRMTCRIYCAVQSMFLSLTILKP